MVPACILAALYGGLQAQALYGGLQAQVAVCSQCLAGTSTCTCTLNARQQLLAVASPPPPASQQLIPVETQQPADVRCYWLHFHTCRWQAAGQGAAATCCQAGSRMVQLHPVHLRQMAVLWQQTTPQQRCPKYADMGL